MGLLLNIDNGGSFTDAFATDGKRVAHTKSPTTPHDLGQCFVDTLRKLSCELYGEEDMARLLGETDHLRYSTTSGTNAVVEHKGSPVGVMVAAGQESSLYSTTNSLADTALWQAMVPIAAVGLSISGGSLDESELMHGFTTLIANGVSRVVVALPTLEQELAVKDAVLERYPRHLLGAIPVLFSHELVRDENDARRLFSAVVNSYLHSGMEHFLYGAEHITKQHHLASPMLVYRNDGDSARVAKTTAIKTYGSGPRGGMEGMIVYAGIYNASSMVGMDIGGTTTDVSMVVDGLPTELAHGLIGDEGLPSSFAMGDIVSIGYGGSSIFRVEGKAIVIGPESVGAAPGPACFGRGGTVATITDALLLAGMIDPDNYLGGELKLDRNLAEAVVNEVIAQPLGLSLEGAVDAMIAAYESQIAGHMKTIADNRGVDIGSSQLLAFGGGGPMNACGIAEAAGFRRVVVPAYSSVFSTYGIGFSDLSHHYRVPVKEAVARGEAAVIEQMRNRAGRDMFGEGIGTGDWSERLEVSGSRDGRLTARPYREGGLEELAQGLEDAAIQLAAIHKLQHLGVAPATQSEGKAAEAHDQATVNIKGETLSVPVYSLRLAPAGATGQGPGLFRDEYLTCLIHAGWSFHVSTNGDLVVEKKP
ncbi:MAG: hydantoinase/oxoprolinase family protein [Halieaceae bacterium]|jgi:N-methylhydantoinase A/oxoprolinase/acetone carboxylase beta subunit|nr:hydantoinase/oxoprolinase family protein [Halieaceae bacterium]